MLPSPTTDAGRAGQLSQKTQIESDVDAIIDGMQRARLTSPAERMEIAPTIPVH
jgi:hypothetical protein